MDISGIFLIGSKEFSSDVVMNGALVPIDNVPDYDSLSNVFPETLEHLKIDHPGHDAAFFMPMLAKIAKRRKNGHILPNLRMVDLQWWSHRRRNIELMDEIEADFSDAGVELIRPQSQDWEDEQREQCQDWEDESTEQFEDWEDEPMGIHYE